jgi:hypothetical protein
MQLLSGVLAEGQWPSRIAVFKKDTDGIPALYGKRIARLGLSQSLELHSSLDACDLSGNAVEFLSQTINVPPALLDLNANRLLFRRAQIPMLSLSVLQQITHLTFRYLFQSNPRAIHFSLGPSCDLLAYR